MFSRWAPLVFFAFILIGPIFSPDSGPEDWAFAVGVVAVALPTFVVSEIRCWDIGGATVLMLLALATAPFDSTAIMALPDIEVVAVAEDGEQGLAAVAEHEPDILLTDIEMPGMTGLELASRLRDHPTVRVVIVTTFARSGYLRRALDAGVSGYVLKDSPIEDLADTLRRVAAGNRVIAPELAVSAWTGSDPLTDREREVLREVGEGHPNVEIAQRLHLAEGTVRNYLSSAIVKLGARNRTEAFAKAQEMGYL